MIQNFIELIQEALDISENVAWVLGKKFQDGKFSAACFDFAAKKENPQKRKSIKKCRIRFNRNNIVSRYCIMSDYVWLCRVAATKKDFDYDKFYRAYADGFLTKDTLQYAYGRINDVHPMHYLRINCTLQQFDEFLNFYGITEGDGMYLAPEDRVAVW